MMKAAPVSAFEMSPAKFLLQFFVVALDTPAQLGDGDEFAQSYRRGQIRQPVSGGLLFRCRPLDQQPLLGMRCFAPVVAAGNANTQGGKP